MSNKSFRAVFVILAACLIHTSVVNAQTIDKEFYDNFLDNTLEWEAPPAAKFSFTDKHLHFENNDENLSASWQNLDSHEAGSIVAVWTTHSSGATDMPYGLCFGGSNYDNEYFFLISADGYFKIGKFAKGEWVTINDWTQSDVVASGQNARNHLKVIIRDTWKFYINSTLVYSMDADTLYGGNAGLVVEGVHAVDFERFLVGFYKAGIVHNEFATKFAALVDDFKNDFANSLGDSILDPVNDTSRFAGLFREWNIKDQLPEFENQNFFRFDGMCYSASYGSYPTRDEAMSAFLKVQDWINYMRTEALLWDGGEQLGDDGVISGNQWLALDVVTGEKGPYADIVVSLNIYKPDESRKAWEVGIQLLHIEKKQDQKP